MAVIRAMLSVVALVSPAVEAQGKERRVHFSSVRGAQNVRGVVVLDKPLKSKGRKSPKRLVVDGARAVVFDERYAFNRLTHGLPNAVVSVCRVCVREEQVEPADYWVFREPARRAVRRLGVDRLGRVRPLVIALRIGSRVLVDCDPLSRLRWRYKIAEVGGGGSAWPGRQVFATRIGRAVAVGRKDSGGFVVSVRRTARFEVELGAEGKSIAWHVCLFHHPLFSVTDQSGRFELPALPPGRYLLRVWHPLLGQRDHLAAVALKPKPVRIVIPVPKHLRESSMRLRR